MLVLVWRSDIELESGTGSRKKGNADQEEEESKARDVTEVTSFLLRANPAFFAIKPIISVRARRPKQLAPK
jgi:hypothetical protein